LVDTRIVVAAAVASATVARALPPANVHVICVADTTVTELAAQPALTVSVVPAAPTNPLPLIVNVDVPDAGQLDSVVLLVVGVHPEC